MDIRVIDIVGEQDARRLDAPRSDMATLPWDPDGMVAVLDMDNDDLGIDLELGGNLVHKPCTSLLREVAGENHALWTSVPGGGVVIDPWTLKAVFVTMADKDGTVCNDLIITEQSTLADLGFFGGSAVWRMPHASAVMPYHGMRRCIRVAGCKCIFPQTGFRNVWIDANGMDLTRNVAFWVEAGDGEPRVVENLEEVKHVEAIGCCRSGSCLANVMTSSFPERHASALVEALKRFPLKDVPVKKLVDGNLNFLCPLVRSTSRKRVETRFDAMKGLLLNTDHVKILIASKAEESCYRLLLTEPVQEGGLKTWRAVVWGDDVFEYSEGQCFAVEDLSIASHLDEEVFEDAEWFVYTRNKERKAFMAAYLDEGKKRKGGDLSSASGSASKKPRAAPDRAAPARRVRREDVMGIYDDYADDWMYQLEHNMNYGQDPSFGWLSSFDYPAEWNAVKRVVLPNFNVLDSGYTRGDAVPVDEFYEYVQPFLADDLQDNLRFGALFLRDAHKTRLGVLAQRVWEQTTGMRIATFRERNKNGPIKGAPVITIWITAKTSLVIFCIGSTGSHRIHEMRAFLVTEKQTGKNIKLDVRNVTNVLDQPAGAFVNPRIMWELGRWTQSRRIDNDTTLLKFISKRNRDGYLYGGTASSTTPASGKSSSKKAAPQQMAVRRSILRNDAPRMSSRSDGRSRKSLQYEMVKDLARYSKDFGTVARVDIYTELARHLPKIMKAIVFSGMTVGEPFFIQLCVMVFWRLPQTVRDRVVQGGQSPVGMDDFDTATLIDKLHVLADALNLRTVLGPALDKTTERDMWLHLCRTDRPELSLTLGLNAMAAKNKTVSHLVKIVFGRIDSASNVAELRLQDALVRHQSRDVDAIAKCLEPFEDLAAAFKAAVDVETMKAAEDLVDAPFVAIGHMGKGKTTFWTWYAHALMSVHLGAPRATVTQVDNVTRILQQLGSVVPVSDIDAKAHIRREDMLRVRQAALGDDLSSMQAFINFGMGLSVVGDGVRGTSQILTEYRDGLLGRLAVEFQQNGAIRTMTAMVDAADVDFLCAWIAEFVSIVNAVGPSKSNPHNKPVRVIVYGPFPFTVVDMPGLCDVRAAVDTIVQGVLAGGGRGVVNHVFHVTHVDQIITSAMERCGQRDPIVICPANVASAGLMKTPLQYARSDDYAVMAEKQLSDYPRAKTVIRGDAFVGLSYCLSRRARPGMLESLDLLPEEVRACQVAQLFDSMLKPSAKALSMVREQPEAIDDVFFDGLAAEDVLKWADAFQKDLTQLRAGIVALFDTEEADVCITDTIGSMIQKIAALEYGTGRWDRSPTYCKTLEAFSRAQDLLANPPAVLLDYQACIQRVVEDYTREATEKLWPVETVVKPVFAKLSRAMDAIAERAALIDERFAGIVRDANLQSICATFGLDIGRGMPTVEEIIEALRSALVNALIAVDRNTFKDWIKNNTREIENAVRPYLWTCLQTIGADMLSVLTDKALYAPSPSLVAMVKDAARTVRYDLHQNAMEAVEGAVEAAELGVLRTLAAIMRVVADGVQPGMVAPVIGPIHSFEDDVPVGTDPSVLGSPIEGVRGNHTTGTLLALLYGAQSGTNFKAILDTFHAMVPDALKVKISQRYPTFLAVCDGSGDAMDVAGTDTDRDRLHAELSVIALVTQTHIVLETQTARVSFLGTYKGKLLSSKKSVVRVCKLKYVDDIMPLLL